MRVGRCRRTRPTRPRVGCSPRARPRRRRLPGGRPPARLPGNPRRPTTGWCRVRSHDHGTPAGLGGQKTCSRSRGAGPGQPHVHLARPGPRDSGVGRRTGHRLPRRGDHDSRPDHRAASSPRPVQRPASRLPGVLTASRAAEVPGDRPGGALPVLHADPGRRGVHRSWPGTG